jgi:DNA polymerase-3 subunit delta
LSRLRGQRIPGRSENAHEQHARDGDAQTLVDTVGRDLRRLEAEIDKLVAYAGASGQITAADVRTVAAEGPAASVFELADAVGERDTPRALRLLRGMLQAGESPLMVHAMIARHVRALVGARALAARGMSPDAMAPEIGMAPWLARNAARQASRYEPSELAAALSALADAEEQMKTSQADAGLVLERWIISTAGAVGSSAARR